MIKILTDIEGVYANGIHCGIKPLNTQKDLALIYVPDCAGSAGVFTKSHFAAPCIVFNKKNGKHNTIKAVIINSGNANTATGKEGADNVKTMAREVASKCGLHYSEVAVASTGIIGKQLTMEPILNGINTLCDDPKIKNGQAAAEAIMTTDLTEKVVTKTVKIGKKDIVISGIAKGSGMIEPNMATMLSYIVTNTSIPSNLCQEWLTEAVDESFNMLSVDTDTSTSDMVLLLSSPVHKFNLTNLSDIKLFKACLKDVCIELTKKIARDGEGATKLIEVTVVGAASKKDARLVAKSVVNSPLVKTAIHGEDPNWGRVAMAIGKAEEAKVNHRKVSIHFEGVCVLEAGFPTDVSREELAKKLTADTIHIDIDLNINESRATAWGCDLTKKYIDINTDYN